MVQAAPGARARRRGAPLTAQRFRGAIAGAGSASGTRVVVGHWTTSPLGQFTDVMLAEPDGTRVLLAPSEAVADFVAATYRFDAVVLGPVVGVVTPTTWSVETDDLLLRLDVGARAPLGRLLRAVPSRLATAPWWCAVTDPVARVAMRGVRTRGTAGNGRREYYGATDLHHVTGLRGSWRGADLGGLRPVTPEPGFGFGSVPEQPSVTSLVTTVRLPAASAA